MLAVVLVVAALGGIGVLLVGAARSGTARVTAWRLAGVGLGLALAVAAVQAGALGRGLLLAGPLCALGVLLGVLGGELSATAPSGPRRTASLQVRRVRDHLPRVLAPVVGVAALLLGLLLATTAALGSPDDLGRAGRWLTVQCSADMGSSTGPWPGSYYAVPLAVVVLVGLVAAAVAVRAVVRRPRPEDGDLALDDQRRDQAARTVVGAVGLLVGVPLLLTSALSAAALEGTCRTAPLSALLTGVLVLLPAACVLLVVCAAAVLTPVRTPVASR